MGFESRPHNRRFGQGRVNVWEMEKDSMIIENQMNAIVQDRWEKTT